MEGSIVGFVSAVIALVAVTVAIWQVRTSSIRAERAISLPVLAEISHEIRSQEFHDSLIRLVTQNPPPVPKHGGFEALPEDFRRTAYRVCYFFDYLGILAKYGIVREDIAAAWAATRLVQVWIIMKPFIEAEREHRSSAFPAEVPKEFLTHYQHLYDVAKKSQITQPHSPT
jgi:hypothetical protein